MNLIGVDIGGTNIRAGLVKDNQLQNVEKISVRKNCEELDVIEDVIALLKNYDLFTVDGIGIGVPSVVDVKKGIVYNVNNIPCWEEVYLKDILEKELGVEVYINNDANCFAVGEKYFGKAKEYKDIVGLITGTGVGAGIIINNKLYAGKNCGAGEFGSIPYKEYNAEYYCSGQFFENVYNVSGDELYKKASVGDSKTIDIFKEYGKNLGELIKMILYTIDPGIIVLGGSVSKSFEFYKEAMWESINNFQYSTTVKKLKIEVSELDQVAILGAAALFYDSQKL